LDLNGTSQAVVYGDDTNKYRENIDIKENKYALLEGSKGDWSRSKHHQEVLLV
jgi:hypothetical protein